MYDLMNNAPSFLLHVSSFLHSAFPCLLPLIFPSFHPFLFTLPPPLRLIIPASFNPLFHLLHLSFLSSPLQCSIHHSIRHSIFPSPLLPLHSSSSRPYLVVSPSSIRLPSQNNTTLPSNI